MTTSAQRRTSAYHITVTTTEPSARADALYSAAIAAGSNVTGSGVIRRDADVDAFLVLRLPDDDAARDAAFALPLAEGETYRIHTGYGIHRRDVPTYVLDYAISADEDARAAMVDGEGYR